MTRTTEFYRYSSCSAQLGLLVLCASILVLSGCAGRRAKAKPFPWSTFAYTRPIALSAVATQTDVGDDPLEDVTVDVEPPPSPLVIARSVPARPRIPASNSSPADAVSKPDVQIAPQLTPAETNAAQQQTAQSLSVAERNIGAVEGKTLNATQQDLASKVRSFMAEARDAANSGDWARARNAAKKAEVLSQELAGSL